MGASVHKAAGHELRRELPRLMSIRQLGTLWKEEKTTWADGCQ